MSQESESAAHVTALQKIVTLQHIHSLYLAAQQSQPPRKDISFNILQLQAMINNNPLINPDFDILNIKGSLDAMKQKRQNGEAFQDILTPGQIVQVISESLSVDSVSEQVISQIPKSTIFRLSNKIDISLVKDRLIKILNSYKNSTLEEITSLELKYKNKKKEIEQIETGRIEDLKLIGEFSQESVIEKSKDALEEAEDAQEASQQELVNIVKEKLESDGGKEITKVLQDLSDNQKKDGKIVLDEEQLEKTLEMAKGDALGAEEKVGDNDDADKEMDEGGEPEAESSAQFHSVAHLKENKSEPLDTPSEPQEEPVPNAILSADSEPQTKLESKSASKEIPSPTPEPATPATPAIGEEELGSKRRGSDSVPPGCTKRFNALSAQFLTQISSNRFASMFMQPVNENEEPNYYKLIRHPVDIKSLGKAIRTGEIKTFDELEFELQLMFSNAIMYNDMHQTETYKWTIEMMEEAQNLLSLFRESSSN
ncbi:hypothetical protein KL933_005314 [Ogataea haglerorum]|uniref:Bromo domain-containing protein n=1 Tax=Ogataea haglerorum TaxID=1937702 RepID=A0AAN6HY29_9ASCO|nr:uncharacterized protein KL911_004721 [Ogataea haglerorum]KAG7691815.1 hypothetical protein KL951_005263 [Ogataea haglerorum]KAG7702272.1 hypothetical protein KL950_005322 [Ogataea haglerorum]KAG7713020.1 hypothetical protein KL949_005314 [Ogataea haglerorum]KAG7713149.1 hypothetical protein KL913_005276 [Ogataea haglerorum]KAG7723839.1 hypothetical protein KL933_005314 [Ogataea haglerorum]